MKLINVFISLVVMLSFSLTKAIGVEATHICAQESNWMNYFSCIFHSIYDDSDESQQRRLSAFCRPSGCWPATRSYTPMNQYLRQQELKNSREQNIPIVTRKQVNGRYLTKPRTSELPFMSGDTSFANSRYTQVNGNQHPVIKCANLAPRDPRHCIA